MSKSKPTLGVAVKASDFAAHLRQKLEALEANPPPPMTPEQQAKVDELVAELSKNPGFVAIQIPTRKK